MKTGRIYRPEAEQNRLVLPRVGFIKVGKKSEQGYPQSVDYFIPAGKYAEYFTKAYGEKPQTIQIVFPDDDPAKVCNERYEYRDDAGDLIASGDGMDFQVWNGKTYLPYSAKEYPDIMQRVAAKNPNKAVKKGDDGWTVVLSLKFIIPLVRGIAGVWEFSTKATASTIPQIRAVFDGMLEERGFVKGIIWDLNVQFATTQKPGDRSRFPVVTMIPNESEENVLKIKQAIQPQKQIEK